MKVTTLKKTVLLALVCAGTMLTSAVQAAHYTNFLDTLETEVATRIENITEETTAQERRALNAASKILSRNTRSLGADLGVLASASTALDSAFAEDETLNTLENDAVNNYAAAAQEQLNNVAARAGDTEMPRALSNLLSQAQAALDRAADTSNSIPVRARAVAFALNKIRAADNVAKRTFKAPLSLEGSTVTLNGRGGFGVTLDSNGTYTIPGDPEETGTWSYERTGAKTGTITASPSSGGTHTLNLTFANSTRGTFAGTTAADESVRGTFTVSND
jgi:hypothetical protein